MYQLILYLFFNDSFSPLRNTFSEAIEKQQQPVGDAQVSGAVKGIPEQQAAKPEEPVRQREGMETVPSEGK